MASEAREDFLKRGSAASGSQRGGGIQGDEGALMKNGDAVGEQIYFGKRVRGEQEGGSVRGEDFGLEEATEIRGGEGIEASCRFVEQQDLRLMQKSTEKAEALDCAG